MINLAIRGGASRVNSYFQLCKEIYNKKIHVDNFSGASGGSIFSGLIAQGYSPEQIKQFFIDIPGDDTMIVAQKLQTGMYPKYQTPFRFAQIYFDVVFKEFSGIKQHFKDNYDWKKCNSKCYFAVFDIMHAVFSSKTIHFSKLDPLLTYKYLKPYYLSNDGIYTVEVFDLRNRIASFKKISNFVVPMWKAVYSSFCMPFFPPNLINTDIGLCQYMDGGFLNNHANLPFMGKEFIQCSVEAPTTIDFVDEYLDKYNDFWYSFNVPKVEHIFKTKTDKSKLGFFSFQKELVEYEFSNAVPSNIFGDTK